MCRNDKDPWRRWRSIAGKSAAETKCFSSRREREGGGREREAADVDTTGAPTGLNVSPCQRLG